MSWLERARHQRARALADDCGAELLLCLEEEVVAWLGDFARDRARVPGPFAAAPALVLGDGRPTLVVSEDERDAAAASGCAVLTYPGYTMAPLRPQADRDALVAELIGGRAVAADGLPAAALLERLGARGTAIVAPTGLAAARARKDGDELRRIAAAARLCDAGHRAARRAAVPGATELEVWAAVRAALDAAAGRPVAALADVLSGERTAFGSGGPTPRVLGAGDPFLFDLAVEDGARWADSCASWTVAGAPSPALARRRQVACDTLATLVDACRPGVAAAEIDELMRRTVDPPHHAGHGVGASWHEQPRLVPGATETLAAGMVVALEPGSYGDGVGVRCEQLVAITDGAATVLSGHRLADGEH